MFTRCFLLLAVLIAVGCSTPPVIKHTLYQDGSNIVRLEAWPKDADLDSNDEFDHPLKISEAEFGIILNSVNLQKRRGFFNKDITAVPAFSKKEVTKMAGPISRALSQASPRERVAFHFKFKKGKLFSGVTSGVFFVQEGRLNLILGRYKSASRPHEKVILPTDPVLPTPPYFGFRLAEGPNQALVPLEESPVWNEPVGDDQWVMMDYRALVAHPSDRVPFSVSKQKSDRTRSESPEADSTSSIKKKLRLLKEIHDEGLISDEEFEQKRQDLLADF